MLNFIKKYNLSIDMDKEKLVIYDEDGDWMLAIDLKDKSIEFDYNLKLKFDFIKDLTKALEKTL